MPAPRSASKPGRTSSGVPVSRARVTTDSPPTWVSGRQASQRSRSGSTPRRPGRGARRGVDGGVGEHDPLRFAGRPAGRDHQGIAGLDRAARPGRRAGRWASTMRAGCSLSRRARFAGRRKAAGRRGARRRRGPTHRRRAATNPGPPGRSIATRFGTPSSLRRDERPGQPASPAPVAARRSAPNPARVGGTGCSRDWGRPWRPAMPFGGGRSPPWSSLAACRWDQLRQRLQRRHPRHRRRAGRTRPAGGVGAGAARGGQAGRRRRVRRGRGRRAGPRRRRRLVADRGRCRCASRLAGSTRAAPGPTVTPGSASCSCSCSSGS